MVDQTRLYHITLLPGLSRRGVMCDSRRDRYQYLTLSDSDSDSDSLFTTNP